MSAISAPGPTLPPQDLDAEQSLLGAMMLSESAVDVATEIVRPNDFYRESHAVVFSAVQSLYGKNSPVDQITVADELATQGKLDDVGGTPFIYSLADAIPAVAAVAGSASTAVAVVSKPSACATDTRRLARTSGKRSIAIR